MITYGVTCPHCKGAVKIEVAIEKARVLVSGVGPPKNGGPPPEEDETWHPAGYPVHRGPVCPEHGRSAKSRYGGLYCPALTEDGGYCKWRCQPAKV